MVVSGLLNGVGPPGQIVDRVLSRKVVIAYDDRILWEYAAVLNRPEFRLDSHDVGAWLELVETQGIHVLAEPLSFALPRAADAKFLEVAVAGNADALITGNLKHFPHPERSPVPIFSPREFVDMQPRR